MLKHVLVGSALLTFFLFSVPVAPSYAEKCRAPKPASAPQLLSATPGDESMTLNWTPVSENTTHYLVAYGFSPEKLEYGNPNVGNNTSFTINHLQNGKKYYFRVAAVNTCRAGELSDKVSAVTGVSTVLPAKQPGRPPVLSIYKAVEDEATASGKTSATNTHTQGAVATASLANCTAVCTGLQFLAAEILLLLVFFALAHKIRRIKLAASLLIPFAIALLYVKFGGPCTSANFFCKYFYPLVFMTYAVSMISYKHFFTHRRRKKRVQGEKTPTALAI